MLLAIQEFEQRFLDVIIPLVPGLEREFFKTSDRFFLCHRRCDRRIKRVGCEVLRVAFFNKIDRSVDKREYRGTLLSDRNSEAGALRFGRYAPNRIDRVHLVDSRDDCDRLRRSAGADFAADFARCVGEPRARGD